MYQLGNEDISSWAARIDTVIGHTPHPVIERVVVVESTDSTQNAALRFAQGRTGLLVVASMQKNGRGARGRRWHDGDRATLPCTFVVDPGCKDAPMLAACVACAVHEAINSFLPRVIQLGIKWPNDLVIRDEHVDRKIAGVLIEQQQGLTLVGIGINCTQTQRDWSPEYADRAVSFLGLGVEPPQVSWGLLAVDGNEAISDVKIFWWVVVFPALAMGSSLLALNVLGDGLRDALDPKLRGKD